MIFLVRPTQLAAIAIGHPVVRPKIAEEILDHLLGPRRLGDKDGAVAVMKHPQPPVAFADPQPGFVRLQSGPGKQSGADCAALRGEGAARGVQHVDERALADLQPENIGQQRRQSLEGDPLREAQIDDEGAQIFPERRALGHIRRRRRFELPGTTRADPAIKRHSRHVGLDRRNFDMIVGFAGELRLLRNIGAAMLAGVRRNIAL